MGPVELPSGDHRVDRRGVEPRSPACDTGVVPLDQRPGAGRFVRPERSARGSNPDHLPTTEACRHNTCGPARESFESSRVESNHRCPDVSRTSCRWTTGRSVAPVPGPGIEPGGRPYERRRGARPPGMLVECAGTELNRQAPGGDVVYSHAGLPMPNRRVVPHRRGGGAGCPRQESNLVSDLRGVVCGVRHTPRTSCRFGPPRGGRVPCPGVEPGLAASKAAVRPPHPQGIMPSPGVEPGPRPSEGRVRNPSHSKGVVVAQEERPVSAGRGSRAGRTYQSVPCGI